MSPKNFYEVLKQMNDNKFKHCTSLDHVKFLFFFTVSVSTALSDISLREKYVFGGFSCFSPQFQELKLTPSKFTSVFETLC